MQQTYLENVQNDKRSNLRTFFRPTYIFADPSIIVPSRSQSLIAIVNVPVSPCTHFICFSLSWCISYDGFKYHWFESLTQIIYTKIRKIIRNSVQIVEPEVLHAAYYVHNDNLITRSVFIWSTHQSLNYSIGISTQFNVGSLTRSTTSGE